MLILQFCKSPAVKPKFTVGVAVIEIVVGPAGARGAAKILCSEIENKATPITNKLKPNENTGNSRECKIENPRYDTLLILFCKLVPDIRTFTLFSYTFYFLFHFNLSSFLVTSFLIKF